MTAELNPKPTSPSDLVEIAGVVSHLYCSKPTFSAGIMTVKHRPVKFSVKGYVKAGEPVTLRGRWATHEKYGPQFEATEVVYTLPTNIDGLARWLEWYGDHIGAVKSQKLIDEYGLDLMPRCCDSPEDVAIFVGVPVLSINILAEKWRTHSSRVAAASQFAAWGMTQHETESILGRFGGSAVQLVLDDPFTLLGRIDGFGWAKVDALAAKVGCVGDDPRRLRGAVGAVVREQYDKGSTTVPQVVACDLAADKIGTLNPEMAARIAETIDKAIEDGRFRRAVDEKSGGAWLATAWGWKCEAETWKVLRTARKPNPHTKSQADPGIDFNILNLADEYRSLKIGTNTVELDEGQRNAVYAAARYRISVVTGGAGAGKTLVARAITKFFSDGDVPVSLCAPTGKAARRLKEVIGIEASTIHRLLEYDGREGRFLRDKDNPLPDGVVIADEASMIDAELGYHLLAALGPKTAIVLIGDPNQLPPVGAGALLRDVLAHNLAPVTCLEKCHRQAGTLKQNCNSVLRGIVEPWASDEQPSPWVVSRKCDSAESTIRVINDLYAKYLPSWGYDPIRQTQFMTAKHDGNLGTKKLNLILQRLHQRALGNDLGEIGEDEHERRPTFYVGDKVIQGRNDYEAEVMNGEIGIVVEPSPCLMVDFDGSIKGYPKSKEGDLALAYCLTPHRMQGSEVECAILIVPKSHAFMQHRGWFYTGVTRAKRTAVIVGDDNGIRRAVERTEMDKRATLLSVFAQYENCRP